MADESERELRRRREALAAKLKTHESEEAAERTRGERSSLRGYAVAFRLSTELIAGVLVGALIGWLLDTFAGTSPWGMIVFVLLGFAAGVLNVLRSSGLIRTSQPGNRPDDHQP